MQKRPWFWLKLLAALTPIVLLAAPAHAQMRAVTLVSATGSTTVRRSTTTGYVTATRGMTLAPGDIVRTGPKAGGVLLFPDGSTIKLRPNSVTVIPEIRAGSPRRVPGPGEYYARIMRGRPTQFEAGRRVVAGVRGTELNIRVDEDETVTLTVIEGEVDFSNAQGAVLVAAAQQSVARPGQAPTPPVVVDPSGIIAWEATVEALAFSIETPLAPPGQPLDRLLRLRERSVALAPQDAAAHLALADVRQELGRLPEAQQAYDQALALQPALRPAQVHRAQLDLRAGRLDEATAAFQRLADTDPASPEGSLGLALTHLATGRTVPATPLLERAASLAPTDPRPPCFLGVVKLRAGDVAAATALFRQSLTLQETFYPAHAYLSFAQTLAGEVAPAVTSARRAVALAPASGLAHEALANALLYAGQPEAAEIEAAQALERNPLSAAARLTQAKLLVATDRLPEGVAAAQQAVALDPRSAVAHTTLGTLLLAQRNSARAEREFRQALALAPAMATAQSGLGAVAAQRGEFTQALAQQKAALALDGSSAGAHNNLGAVYLAQGKLSASIAELRQAAALQPAWGLPHANLAQAYLELNRYAEAVEEGERAVRLGERSAVLHTTLARVYARQRRVERALSELRQAEALDPDYPQAQFQLSRLYLEQNRDRDALKAILRATSVQPSAMVENRLYARTEATLAGGSLTTRQLDGKTDGRGLGARLSYFTSGSRNETDNDRENGDQKQTFGLGLMGWEPDSYHQWLVYGSGLERKNGRPGREIGGAPEDADFRSQFEGWEAHAVHRMTTGRRSHLTMKVGTRTSDLTDRNPTAGTTAAENPFRRLDNRLEETLAELRWDGALTRADRWTLGFAWRDENRRVHGDLFVVDPTTPDAALRLEPTALRDDTSHRTFYAEWQHRAGDRLDVKLGGYLDRPSGLEALALPKLVARYRPAGHSYLVFLAYPTFRSDATELSPVEAWAQPFGFDRLDFTDDGWAMSYELHYERPMSRLSLLSLSAFTRGAHGLLLDLEDPRLAPAPTRLLVGRARVSGAQAAFERTLGRALTGRVFALYQDTEDRGSHADLPYLAPWQSGARLDYLDRAGWRCFAALTYLGRRLADRNSGTRLGGYAVLDLRIARQFNLHQSLFLQVSNLLDRGYATFAGYPAAGRSVVGGVEYRF